MLHDGMMSLLQKFAHDCGRGSCCWCVASTRRQKEAAWPVRRRRRRHSFACVHVGVMRLNLLQFQ